MLAQNLKYLVENSGEPLVFHNILDWEILNWNLDDWRNKIGEAELSFRQGKFEYSTKPQWENSTTIIKGTFQEFLDHARNSTDEWLYFDYKYLREWFLHIPELQKTLNWSKFGFPNLQCEDSTIWIGSKGAHTPCHIDTYGYNLVAQIYGRKQWLLFPPEENLLPTRIPYEESSIYSKINFFSPPENCLKGRSNCRRVVLSPGDVLFVPNNWWHYVENQEIAISVNTWIPLASDDEKRLEEALVQMLIAKFTKDLSVQEKLDTLQPNSENVLLQETCLKSSLNTIETCLNVCEDKQIKSKKVHTRYTNEICEKYSVDDMLKENPGTVKRVDVLTPEECFNLLEGQRNRFPTQKNEDHTSKIAENVLECLTHPDVINLVKNKLLKRQIFK